jgi:hypothetical protein
MILDYFFWRGGQAFLQGGFGENVVISVVFLW